MEDLFDKNSEYANKTPDELRQMAAEARERAKIAKQAAAEQRRKLSETQAEVEPEATEESDMSKRMAAVRAKIASFRKEE